VNARAEQKERTRSLRRGGIAASTVADVMKAAGLTVGGFYAHFQSKQDLLAQAMRATSRQMWSRELAVAEAEHAPGDRARAMVDAYLSEQHRDDLEEGCLLPATVAEVAREGRPYRAVLSATINGLATELGQLMGGGPKARRRALGLIALMYGGLSIARALGKGALSTEMLEAARQAARATERAA
jgi:TetR/AcrR family transcriptional repressor of nem operon